MFVSMDDYKLNKKFQLISSLISDIVRIKLMVRTLSVGKINYHKYLANAPSDVDTHLLSLLFEQQNRRIHVIIELMKQETSLRKVLREVSRELGDSYRCNGFD